MIVPLKLYPVTANDQLTKPESTDEITPNSSALTIFTDFKEHYPFHLNHKTTAKEARLIMSNAHARLRFIVDDTGVFVGVVTLDDLSEQKMIQELAKGNNESDILVTDFMQPRDLLHAFDFEEIRQAKIIDVIETLKRQQQKHCLVVDEKNHEIRGIISGSDMGRKLNMSIDINRESNFADIAKAILNNIKN